MARTNIRLDVNKNVFSWAIARAGLTSDDVVKSYPKLLDWESGKTLATANQLKDFSKKFRFPFGYFFLSEIPQDSIGIPFFRSFAENDAVSDFNIRELIRILTDRKEWVSDYLKTNGADKLSAVGLYKDESDVIVIKNGILDYLGLEDGWQLAFKTPEQAIKHIVSLLEENNIFVTFNSVVGFDSHRQIPVKLCRGFCLVDDYAPFIFVNSNDSKKAQLFTLIHELAHIFVSFSSGYGDFGADDIDNAKENLCDKVAANFLVPKELFLQNERNRTNEELSTLFKVSEIVILRRKLNCGIISKDSFFRQYNNLSQFKKTGSGGGNFYNSAPYKINGKFLRCLHNAMTERNITPMEAYRLAGIKGDTFSKLTSGGRL